jgi:hypothetical protein
MSRFFGRRDWENHKNISSNSRHPGRDVNFEFPVPKQDRYNLSTATSGDHHKTESVVFGKVQLVRIFLDDAVSRF